ncbi:TfuA-like protein [Nonomuraea typhae]|uniref:TfuA-like protein n=1 Tax=Nonomuraea typhae TaxID=2603600 RepID=UPI0012FA45DF|nr:TfuA-like protein [Nonomuraea typhae]
MSCATTVVYTGPTLAPGDVLGVLPEAQVRPPVSRGDLMREDWTRGDTAVLIDGYYRERLSVGHKEILWLLNEGVTVIGAASMGALRAAELSPYGMRGVGSVYDMYATGRIDGDDEVAVLHGPAESGYRSGTIAMVNLRYGCAEGARAGLIPPDSGDRIVAAAKDRPFVTRTWPDLEASLAEADHESLRTLRRMIGTGEWDLKRRDAVAALEAVGDRPAGQGRTWAAALTGITHHELLKAQREYAPGRWMSDLDVLNAARLFDPGYPLLHEWVLTGMLTGFAGEQGLTLEEHARARLGVGDAVPDGPAAWLTERERAALPVGEQVRLVMVRVWPVWQSADWRPVVLEEIRESGGWQEWADVVARADEATERARGRLAVPAPEVCGRIFLRHWHEQGTAAEIEMARRGFTGLDVLGRAVRRFFALDVENARRR